MTGGCQTCGGYGNRHDPIAHDAEPQERLEECRRCQGLGGDLDGTPCSDCLGYGSLPADSEPQS